MRWTLEDISRKPAVAAQIYPQAASPALAVKSPHGGKEQPLSPSGVVLPNSRGRPKKRNDESLSQQAVIKWWALVCHEFNVPEELLMAYPLQSNRHIRNAVRMKKEGCRAGTPDLQLQVSRGDCLTLFIEMKSPKGYVQPHQKRIMKMLTDHGHATCVCRSAESAIKAITGYLLMPKP